MLRSTWFGAALRVAGAGLLLCVLVIVHGGCESEKTTATPSGDAKPHAAIESSGEPGGVPETAKTEQIATPPAAKDAKPEGAEEAKTPLDSPSVAQGGQAAEHDALEPTGVVNWPFVRVDTKKRCVEIDGVIATTEGWLEQVVCNVGTRDYEAVIATRARASHIHAGLLLLGLAPGHPGSWKIDPDDPQQMKWVVVPPEGAKVWVRVSWTDADGKVHDADVQQWVRDHDTGRQFPAGPWIFGGSMMRRNYEGREVYAADSTGSICGLVTFGDEMLGWSEIFPDQIEVQAAQWEADTEAMPPAGTVVVVRLLVRNEEGGP